MSPPPREQCPQLFCFWDTFARVGFKPAINLLLLPPEQLGLYVHAIMHSSLKAKNWAGRNGSSITLAMWEKETGRITVQGQPGQKAHETPISTNGWVWWYAPLVPDLQGSTNRTTAQSIKWDTNLKNIQCKNGWWSGSTTPPWVQPSHSHQYSHPKSKAFRTRKDNRLSYPTALGGEAYTHWETCATEGAGCQLNSVKEIKALPFFNSPVTRKRFGCRHEETSNPFVKLHSNMWLDVSFCLYLSNIITTHRITSFTSFLTLFVLKFSKWVTLF
jgi:hypothetical protein